MSRSLSYKADVAPENSRYYLEINLLRYAMNVSSTIAGNPESILWKLTGRYIVSNIARIVGAGVGQADLQVNLRNYPRRTLDFYLVGYRSSSFDRHIGRDMEDYRTTRNGEDILREKIDARVFKDVRISPRLAYTPRLLGVRGFDGARYGGINDTLKYIARSSLNKLAPALWI